MQQRKTHERSLNLVEETMEIASPSLQLQLSPNTTDRVVEMIEKERASPRKATTAEKDGHGGSGRRTCVWRTTKDRIPGADSHFSCRHV